MSPADAFEPLRFALERAGIRYAIGGSWASTAFGEPRFTNDIDILGEFTEKNLEPFLETLPDTFYVDREEALTAIRHGRSFNAIYMPMAFKFDFFPAAAFALGHEELDRAIYLTDTGLTNAPAPFVTPEDILLAKLFWFRLGGETSEGGATYKASLGVVRTLSTAATCRARRSSCRLATCWRERLKKLRRGSRASRS
ncbi:MAG: hypothetical protein ACRD6B_22515 [Bryobacteraceae bacterium]